MTDRIQLRPAQAFATCTQLPGRETNLVRREMANASGGMYLLGRHTMIWFIAERIAEAVADYFDD